jgi:endo-1,4-beta-xylanase
MTMNFFIYTNSAPLVPKSHRTAKAFLAVQIAGTMLLFLTGNSAAQSIDTGKGLKDHYKNYFPIGVAVSSTSIRDIQESALITKEFNSITPENAMKMGPIHPEENRYNWAETDAIVDYAVAHHLKVRGHNLCWHEQTPKWLFYDNEGKLVTKAVLLKRLKDHIFTVVKRYKGKIYAWDVVNEVISDDQDQFLRNSPWYQICGEDFIFKAFEYAHEADPKAVLFYNDYNTERPEKRERVYRLMKKLVNAKIPINGIGLQAHWSIYEPSQKELTDAIERFASLGLKIQITELDMSVYPWEKSQRKKKPDDIDSYTPQMAQKQNDQYNMVFKTLRKYKKVITGVTFWNISDRNTWLDDYPVKGRKNYPLLFDTNLKRKPAYWQILDFGK